MLRCAGAVLLAVVVSLAARAPRGGGSGGPVYAEHSAALPVLAGGASARDAEHTPAPAEGGAASREQAQTEPGFRLASPVITVSIKGEPVEMALEDYLVGVVAAEMPYTAEPAALRAQAVAARTFAAQHMAGMAKCSHGAPGCEICDDASCCQAYLCEAELAAAWGGAYSENIERIRSAVRATEGVIVMYDGRPISAMYHASSGTATESCEAVFAMAVPYLVSVDSCEGETASVSVHEFTAEELAQKVNSALPEAKLGVPLAKNDIEVWGRTESGRVQLVRVGETVVSGLTLRMMLGLKSAAFTVDLSPDRAVFTCTGYGHGVGMSQYGAMEMAAEGSTYSEILLHYYTGTELGMLEFDGE